MFESAGSYDRFMGRYSHPLAGEFADFAMVSTGHRALDVGCGPGALTGELVARLGSRSVAAVDPSPNFATTVEERYPDVDVRVATAEDLPFDSEEFDATLAQLVVHFMSDPVAGLEEMRRVTRHSGVVAACVWDFTRDRTPLTVFWKAARKLDPSIETESRLPGARAGHLGEMFATAGLEDIEEAVLSVDVEHADFDDWWEPFTLGVGPAGDYVASLDDEARVELRESCRAALPDGPFVLNARAWSARGRA